MNAMRGQMMIERKKAKMAAKRRPPAHHFISKAISCVSIDIFDYFQNELCLKNYGLHFGLVDKSIATIFSVFNARQSLFVCRSAAVSLIPSPSLKFFTEILGGGGFLGDSWGILGGFFARFSSNLSFIQPNP